MAAEPHALVSGGVVDAFAILRRLAEQIPAEVAPGVPPIYPCVVARRAAVYPFAVLSRGCPIPLLVPGALVD